MGFVRWIAIENHCVEWGQSCAIFANGNVIAIYGLGSRWLCSVSLGLGHVIGCSGLFRGALNGSFELSSSARSTLIVGCSADFGSCPLHPHSLSLSLFPVNRLISRGFPKETSIELRLGRFCSDLKHNGRCKVIILRSSQILCTKCSNASLLVRPFHSIAAGDRICTRPLH